MNPKHSNPSEERVDKDNNKIWARAPYNFVPLPEKIVPARPPLDQDQYHLDQGFTGWIECELKTCSPTYIRGMLTEVQYKEQGKKKPDELSEQEKEQHSDFFGTITQEGKLYPIIPGSSLRGMIRSLVEVVGYGRVRWVGKEPAFTFRSVAASTDDPLRDPYQDILGKYGRDVKAGYLKKKGDDWYVQPALTPADMKWPNKRDAYLKVKEHQIGSKDLPDFIRFDSPKYRPQLHQVSFNVDIRNGRRGRFVTVNQIGERNLYQYKGVLVCSGNMLETADSGQESPRRNHALVLAPSKSREIKVDPQAVIDYQKGMTTFERDELEDWDEGNDDPGCLGDGNPVFYVTEGDQVVQFGHCPNFRVAARQNCSGVTRATTPLDFVPKSLRRNPHPDLADAIFGWVEEEGYGLEGQRAGRVFFGDASCVDVNDDEIWYKNGPIPLHVLSNPKPTTFQHYLVQDAKKGHHPDRKPSLANFGTPSDETSIRGHKFYWFKGSDPDIEASTEERAHESQLTRVQPIGPGVRFKFKIKFENLRPEEVGLLLWALTIPGDSEKEYRHHVGMGKPLGMGAVEIHPELVLSDRKNRYLNLFSEQNGEWATKEKVVDAQPYLEAFEKYMAYHDIILDGEHLADVDRIKALLTMMEWRSGESSWRNWTRYMEIEYGLDKVNEYKERPVLPTPQGVVDIARGKPQQSISESLKHGEVKVFGLGRGQSYGFIKPDDGGDDIFVHRSQLKGIDTLEKGQRVIFTIGEGQKGPVAQDVRLE